jgi:hypothetical protein
MILVIAGRFVESHGSRMIGRVVQLSKRYDRNPIKGGIMATPHKAGD